MLARILFMPLYLIIICSHQRNDPIAAEIARRLCGINCPDQLQDL